MELHGVYWIPQNPWSSMHSITFHRRQKYPSFVWGSMEAHGFKRNITDSTETLEIHTIPMVPWNFLEVHGAPLFLKSYMEFIELHTDCTEVHGTHGIPWEPRSSWNPYKTGIHGVPDQRFYDIL